MQMLLLPQHHDTTCLCSINGRSFFSVTPAAFIFITASYSSPYIYQHVSRHSEGINKSLMLFEIMENKFYILTRRVFSKQDLSCKPVPFPIKM